MPSYDIINALSDKTSLQRTEAPDFFRLQAADWFRKLIKSIHVFYFLSISSCVCNMSLVIFGCQDLLKITDFIFTSSIDWRRSLVPLGCLSPWGEISTVPLPNPSSGLHQPDASSKDLHWSHYRNWSNNLEEHLHLCESHCLLARVLTLRFRTRVFITSLHIVLLLQLSQAGNALLSDEISPWISFQKMLSGNCGAGKNSKDIAGDFICFDFPDTFNGGNEVSGDKLF